MLVVAECKDIRVTCVSIIRVEWEVKWSYILRVFRVSIWTGFYKILDRVGVCSLDRVVASFSG